MSKNLSLLKNLTEIRLKQNNGYISVQGISMKPLISDGDGVKVQREESYRVGDVVVALDSLGRLLVHRVLVIDTEKLYIKGDNAVAIEVVDKVCCFGRVTEIIKDDERKIPVKRGLKSRLVALLSLRMHERWKKTNDYEGVLNGYLRKIIALLTET